MWDMHDVGWGWWLLMSVGMVAFWALVVYGLVMLARGGFGASRSEQWRAETPSEVLKRRLASGEITVEEYEHLQRTLAGEAPTRPREPTAS